MHWFSPLDAFLCNDKMFFWSFEVLATAVLVQRGSSFNKTLCVTKFFLIDWTFQFAWNSTVTLLGSVWEANIINLASLAQTVWLPARGSHASVEVLQLTHSRRTSSDLTWKQVNVGVSLHPCKHPKKAAAVISNNKLLLTEFKDVWMHPRTGLWGISISQHTLCKYSHS